MLSLITSPVCETCDHSSMLRYDPGTAHSLK